MKIIWVVGFTWGEYADREEKLELAFESQAKAEEYVRQANEKCTDPTKISYWAQAVRLVPRENEK